MTRLDLCLVLLLALCVVAAVLLTALGHAIPDLVQLVTAAALGALGVPHARARDRRNPR